ncbi:MAG: L,D-transpeptidase [Chloroflexi bacterium]|nr:L,D-transpeptidase [Chloroflexota bacterium]
MRRILTTFFAVYFLLESLPLNRTIVAAQSGRLSELEPDSGSVVCPPGVYEAAPDGCLPLGPSEYLTQLASEGIPYPIQPLPAYKPDPAYNDLPYQYFWINKNGTPFYASLDAAVANQPSGPHLYPSNHLLVSYQELVDYNQDTFYRLRSNWWIRADGGRLARFDPPFQGLLFSSTPRNAFGWVLGEIQSRTAPGVNSPESGITHYRFEVVQIYATQSADNLTWTLIGPGEWLDSRQISRVDPATAPPKGVAGGRWIEVNLFEQTVTVYDNNRLIFATMVSTGIDRFWTRPGLFQIHNKLETETMSNSIPDDFYYLEDVPWTMYFDEDRALHGAYWHNGFGYARSHGCVNISVGDSHWLFDWANVGDTVYVYDPSGRTPVDPSLYGNGGY